MPRFVPSFLKNQEQASSTSNSSNQLGQEQEQQWKEVRGQQYQENNYAAQLQHQEAPSRFGRFVNRNTVTPNNTPATVTPNNEYREGNRVAIDVSGNASRFAPIVNKNKFETLAEDYVPEPIKKLTPSKPPRVTDVDIGSTSNTKSFASKFSEKQGLSSTTAKSLSAPSFIKIPKTDSFEEFPSLGGTPKKTPSASSQLNELDTPKSTSSFANLAKGWAKKSEQEELLIAQEKQRKEKERFEEEIFRKNVFKFNDKIAKKRMDYEEDEDEFGDNQDEYEQHSDALDDGEEFEVPSGEEDMGDPSEDDSDYDNNNGETPEYEERF